MNIADEDEVAEAKKAEQRLLDLDKEDMKWIISNKHGRRFIWNLLGDCGVFKSSFDGSSHTFFREGERNVALKILARLNDADAQAYVTMVMESQGGVYV